MCRFPETFLSPIRGDNFTPSDLQTCFPYVLLRFLFYSNFISCRAVMSRQFWITVVRVDILTLFVTSGENNPVFHHWVWRSLKFHKASFPILGEPSYSCFLGAFVMEETRSRDASEKPRESGTHVCLPTFARTISGSGNISLLAGRANRFKRWLVRRSHGELPRQWETQWDRTQGDLRGAVPPHCHLRPLQFLFDSRLWASLCLPFGCSHVKPASFLPGSGSAQSMIRLSLLLKSSCLWCFDFFWPTTF